MTKLFATTALVASLALPALAVQPAEDEVLAESQSFAFWLPDAVGTLDPARHAGSETADLLRQLFEGLMNEDATGAMVPGVAESHQASEDGLSWTFHLREARWSNGDPVTAGDFVHAWRRVVAPATQSEHARVFQLMNVRNAARIAAGDIPPEELGVTAPDDRTLRVSLAAPTPHFLKMLSHPATFPVPRAVIEAEGEDWTLPGKLIGNGAFTLQDHDPGVEITLARNPEYWDAGSVVMDTLRAVTVNDITAALARYREGELDRVPIPAGQYPHLRQQFPDHAVALPVACTYAYVYNLSDKGPEALKDVRLRRALSLALDRDRLVNDVLQGGQRPAASWTHWAIEGFAPPETGPSQAERTARARQLLAQAGHGPDNPLGLVLQYNTDENHKQLAVAVRQAWKELGVDLALNNLDWKTHAERMERQDFDIARYAWCADYNAPAAFLDWFRSDGPNIGKWSNAEYDRLLAEARTAADPAPLYARAEAILAEEAPAAFLYHYARAEMINPAIRGLPTESATGNWYAKDLYRLAD